MDYYRQCVLKKGNTTTTYWIPEKFTKITMILELRNDKKEWDDGWRVISVGDVRLPEDVVVTQEKDYKEFSYHMLKFGNKKREGL
jgi:hypothetical protein